MPRSRGGAREVLAAVAEELDHQPADRHEGGGDEHREQRQHRPGDQHAEAAVDAAVGARVGEPAEIGEGEDRRGDQLPRRQPDAVGELESPGAVENAHPGSV